MRELTLIVTDLYLAPELRESLADSVGSEASLPTLELLLARASERRPSEWRAFACELAQVPVAGAVPIAALMRVADDHAVRQNVSSEQWWIASPVHLVAALDHVQLSAAVRLEPQEAQQIVSGFNHEFGVNAGELFSQDAELFWRAPEAIDARTVDPARVTGSDVHDALPAGPDGARLRQLTTEVQMWLHAHPLNAAREARGSPPVNGLWFWGGGSLPAWPSAVQLPLLIGNDRFMRGLWSLLGGRSEPLSAAWAGSASRGARGIVVTLSLHELAGVAGLEGLRTLEGAWLAPALSALRARRVDRLRLQMNDVLFTIERKDMRRFWRRSRPWFEAFA